MWIGPPSFFTRLFGDLSTFLEALGLVALGLLVFAALWCLVFLVALPLYNHLRRKK